MHTHLPAPPSLQMHRRLTAAESTELIGVLQELYQETRGQRRRLELAELIEATKAAARFQARRVQA